MKADFDISAGLLGDACLPEPALNAYGLRNGGSVSVHVRNPAVRALYEHHPVIRLADEPGGKALNESDAFWWAVSRERYFAEGFWDQVGLGEPAPGERTHFRVHWPDGDWTLRDDTLDCIVLCPFSRSCDGAKGFRPNKTVPVAWWEDVIRLVGPIPAMLSGYLVKWYSLGSADDPPVDGTTSLRGLDLMAAAGLILRSRLLVTVETWANIVAADKAANGKGQTLFMSAAVPLSFIQPPGSEVVRHPWPDQWDKQETVDKIRKLLEN